MPAATTRAELVTATEREWGKVQTLLASLPETIALRPFEGGVSIKDVVSHRAHWIGLFFQWLEEGDKARMPDHGVGWGELKSYNARLRDLYAGLSWPEALGRLAEAHALLLNWMRAVDDAVLYSRPMPGGNGKWTTGRYAEAAGPSHYRSAAKFVRACLRAS